MNSTTRRFTRTRREAFPSLYSESALGITGPIEIGRRSFLTWPRLLVRRIFIRREKHTMNAVLNFVTTYCLYRKGGNTIQYSLRIAYGCAVCGLPF